MTHSAGMPVLIRMLARAGPWDEDAACREHPVGMWFPEPYDYVSRRDATAICEACPVRLPCLALAVKNGERYGIWGGRTPKQRARLRSRMAA